MRKIGREERTVVLILYPMAANFVVMGAAMPFVYEPMPGRDLALLALIAASRFIATNLMIFAYRAAPAATVAPMQYSQIIWASAYGACSSARRWNGRRFWARRSSWPRVSTSSSARIAAAGPPRPRSCARARACLALPPRAWPRSSPQPGAPARGPSAPTRGRLTPLHWPCVGAIPRGTVGV
jgi:hypothetical protein